MRRLLGSRLHAVRMTLIGARAYFDSSSERDGYRSATDGLVQGKRRSLPCHGKGLRNPAEDLRKRKRMTSIVVPTRDRPELAERCLASLAKARGVGEVIVVDDGSSPSAGRSLVEATRRHGFTLLRNHSSRGPAAARNRGWRQATGDFVAFTDDDCAVDEGWAETLSSALEAAPPEIVGIGGRVLPASAGLISDYMTAHRILEPPQSLSYLVTANACFRHSVLKEVGGFDEAVRTPGGEDPGLCFVLRRRGYEFRMAPDAVVHHHYRESLRDFLKTFYRYGRGCRVVMDR